MGWITLVIVKQFDEIVVLLVSGYFYITVKLSSSYEGITKQL